MNDKNFIEELRQKREEYGVTQRKLAVACGISRTYFNQIENGTVVPSAELKQTIEKQIERFNPQEPLFLLIDYFRVRFPTTDALKIIREVLQLKADYMLYEDFGKYGYEELSKMEQDMIGAEKWIELIKEYSVPKELTAPLLNAMIEKILIHEATTNEENERIQEIEIYYRFIGKVD